MIVHPGMTMDTLGPVELAHEVEQRGLTGIYLPEHTHIPVDVVADEYPVAGAVVADRYRRLVDPYVALSFVAATSPGLEIGTCISLIGQHDPIVLAKTVATLDQLSGGHFVMGVGMGWSSREFESHHPSLGSRRGEIMTESARALQAIWHREIADFQGKHVRVPPVWSWPKPLQQPHPPMLLGGRGTERTFGRIADWADGWISLVGHLHAESYPGQLDRLRQVWVAAGRDPAALRLMVLEEPGGPGHVARSVARATELGVDRLILHVEDRARDELMPILDEAAAATEAHAGSPRQTSQEMFSTALTY